MDKEPQKIDLLILGGGPAGLSAAIYAARAKLNTVVLETGLPGGQIRDSQRVDNYPGYSGIKGSDLADIFAEQTAKAGAQLQKFSKILQMKLTESEMLVETKKAIYLPKAVIIATGASPKKLPIPSEEAFLGKGVHYCSICDGAAYEGAVVGIVGGGNKALEEALYLAKIAEKVIMIRRNDSFNGEKALIEEVNNNPKIDIRYNWDLVDVEGTEFVEAAWIQNTKTGEKERLTLSAVFGSIGMDPKTAFLNDILPLTQGGYIITDNLLQTNIPGVFAAGDVLEKTYRQITTAVADGSIAALNAEKFIRRISG